MLRTRSGLPKHCGWNADRHGTRRVRFRKAGFTNLTAILWSARLRSYGGFCSIRRPGFRSDHRKMRSGQGRDKGASTY